MLTVSCFGRLRSKCFSRSYANNVSKDASISGLKGSSHNDLSSFLDYAARTNLDTRSTTYVGTHYEYTVQSSLEGLGISLKRIGGKSDNGIDLVGTWSLPSSSEPIKVIVQCKALAQKIGPSLVRELEGAFVGAPEGWRASSALAFLVSQKTATKGVREALGRSRWPMGYVLCNAEGRVLQMLWNRRAEENGLEGVHVEAKYSTETSTDKTVVLTWKDAIVTQKSSLTGT